MFLAPSDRRRVRSPWDADFWWTAGRVGAFSLASLRRALGLLGDSFSMFKERWVLVYGTYVWLVTFLRAMSLDTFATNAAGRADIRGGGVLG